jgi:hypothetical protein
MTYACLTWESETDSHLLKVKSLHSFPDFHTYMMMKQNYTGNKQKSYKIMKLLMFAEMGGSHGLADQSHLYAAWLKMKPDTGNTRGSNWVAVKHMTFQLTRLPL